MSKKLWMTLAVGAAFAIAGCGDETTDQPPPAGDEGPYDLTFSGSGFSPHNAHTLRAALLNASTNAVVVAPEVITIDNGNFTVTWPNVLVKGTEYVIHAWADSNFNGGTAGTCDPSANDHQWAYTVA